MNDSQERYAFHGFSFPEKKIIYQGLLSLVKSNSGVGFCNSDQGHPAYAVGRSGKYDYEQFGDSPERNNVYQMMHALSVSLSEAELDSSSEIREYVFCWTDFCTIAYQAYEEAKNKC